MTAPFTLMLDFDGVVMFDYHHNPLYRRDWATTLEQDLGINRASLQKAVFQNPAYRPVQMGQVDILEFLSDVLPTLGYQGTAQSFIDYWISRTSKPENLDHAMLVHIQTLRQNHAIKVYLITVQNHFRRLALHRDLHIDRYVDGVFYASDLGFFKDDPRFYQAVTGRCGLDPAKDPILMFDDRPEFVAAAKTAGWEAVVYNTLPDFATHPWVARLLNQPKTATKIA
jgi:putative hydrolase of the HAD superfamily